MHWRARILNITGSKDNIFTIKYFCKRQVHWGWCMMNVNKCNKKAWNPVVIHTSKKQWTYFYCCHFVGVKKMWIMPKKCYILVDSGITHFYNDIFNANECWVAVKALLRWWWQCLYYSTQKSATVLIDWHWNVVKLHVLIWQNFNDTHNY